MRSSSSSWPPDSPVPLLLARLLAGDTAALRSRLEPRSLTSEMLLLIAAGARELKWFGVNEQRVDALVSAGADEFRVVFFTGDGEAIDELFVFRRPEPFDGVDGGRVVVVNGPSGAGKSSVLAAIAAISDLPWVMFDEPVVGAVRSPYLIWRDRAPVLHRGFLDAVVAVARRGNLVGLSAGGHPAALIDETLEGVETLRVGLDCDHQTLIERERGREGRWGGLATGSLGDHRGWRYDARFDTTKESADAIALHLLGQMRLLPA